MWIFLKYEQNLKFMWDPHKYYNLVLIEYITEWASQCMPFTFQMMITSFMMICHVTLVDMRVSPINTLINDEKMIIFQHSKVTLNNCFLKQSACPLVPILTICLFRWISFHCPTTTPSLSPPCLLLLLYTISTSK